MGFFSGVKDFMMGTPGKSGDIQQISTLDPQQEKLKKQLVNAGQRRGAGGAFGDVSDYYRNNLSDNPADFQAFAAPQLRQYNEDIMPGISEQFAGMGSGGLSSSGFRNAQIQGATDLSERLGAIRANLRHSSAQGLQNIGQLGLQSFQQNFQQPGTPGTEGFLSKAAPAIGTGIGYAVGGPIGGAIGGGLGNWFKGSQTAASPSSSAGANVASSVVNSMRGGG